MPQPTVATAPRLNGSATLGEASMCDEGLKGDGAEENEKFQVSMGFGAIWGMQGRGGDSIGTGTRSSFIV